MEGQSADKGLTLFKRLPEGPKEGRNEARMTVPQGKTQAEALRGILAWCGW